MFLIDSMLDFIGFSVKNVEVFIKENTYSLRIYLFKNFIVRY